MISSPGGNEPSLDSLETDEGWRRESEAQSSESEVVQPSSWTTDDVFGIGRYSGVPFSAVHKDYVTVLQPAWPS